MSVFELLAAVIILAIVSGLLLITPFAAYNRARAASDAAATVAQDVALLERIAQNGGANDGATLQVTSASPLAYDCYYGRPNALDPNSVLGPLIVHRSFDDVALTGGPIDAITPLLFASNGSIQYVSAGVWADQHQTIELTLTPAGDHARAARVDLNLFTGGVSLP